LVRARAASGRGGFGDCGGAMAAPWTTHNQTVPQAAQCLGAAAAQPPRSYMRSPHKSPLRALWAGHAGWRSMGRLSGRTASLKPPTGRAPARTSTRTTGADDGRVRTAGLDSVSGACAYRAAPEGQLLQSGPNRASARIICSAAACGVLNAYKVCSPSTSLYPLPHGGAGAPSLRLAGGGEERGEAASAHAAAAAPPAAAAAPPAGLPRRRRQRSAAPPGAPPAGAPGPACQRRAGPGRPPAPPQLCEWWSGPHCWRMQAGISDAGRHQWASLHWPAQMDVQSWHRGGCAPAAPAPAAQSGAPGQPWPPPCPGCAPWHAGESSPRGNISGQTVGMRITQAPDTARKQIPRITHAARRAPCLGPLAQRAAGQAGPCLAVLEAQAAACAGPGSRA